MEKKSFIRILIYEGKSRDEVAKELETTGKGIRNKTFADLRIQVKESYRNALYDLILLFSLFQEKLEKDGEVKSDDYNELLQLIGLENISKVLDDISNVSDLNIPSYLIEKNKGIEKKQLEEN